MWEFSATKSVRNDEVAAEKFPFALNQVNVDHGVEMAYIDTDPSRTLKDPPVVFMHGNPAYSYLWRNIIPHVSPKSRCIAPDLIGMGSSSTLPSDAYGWNNHNRYLDAFFSKIVGSGKVVLVLHDFGSLFGLNWARRHADQIAGLVLMEFLPPMPTWKDTGELSEELHNALIGLPENLRKAIIDDNVFIELFMQDQVIRTLSPIELDHYRKPFLNPANRESIYEMAKIFPVAGNPPEIYHAVENYNSWLLENEIPSFSSGRILSVPVGHAKHYLQEDHPHLIGSEIKVWLETAGILDAMK
ncbi:hypothetical protein VF21_08704 [Pseudogymnoascus sp. 05NY08]|nr:hypothetical protein VF21_08704 [Pseudogymnoascus sp. 05NY08]